MNQAIAHSGEADGVIGDDDCYVLNPYFRMRNDHYFTRLYGWEGMGDYHLHPTTAVIVALCNGKRTVGEIAKLVRPFVPDGLGDRAEDAALKNVKSIIEFYIKSAKEQKGEAANSHSELPSEAALVPLSLMTQFTRGHAPQYDPLSFLPERAPAVTFDDELRDKAPSRVNWHLTSACATDCKYCYLTRRTIPPAQMMSRAKMVAVVKELSEFGVFEIMPSGGDVLLYPYLLDFLENVRSHRFLPMRLSTKAYLSKTLAKRLAEYSDMIFCLQFSLDSVVEEEADYLTGTPGFYQRAMESIHNALDAGLQVSAKAVITPYNILSIPRLYRTLKSLGLQKVLLALYSRSGYHHTDDLFNHQESYEWLKKEILTLESEYPNDLINLQNAPLGTEALSEEKKEESWAQRARCSAGRSSLMICADGKIIPCEQLPENEEMFVGDLTAQSLEAVWNGKRLAEMTYAPPREKFVGTPCWSCEEFETGCLSKMGYCVRDEYVYYQKYFKTPSRCPKSDSPFVRTT